MIATERNGKATIYGQNGRLSVKDGKLVNKNGEVVVLKGLSTHNMNSFPQFVNNDAIEFMADNWGMEMFRLAMYTAWADGDKGYTDGTDEHRAELEEMILRSAKKCAELGIYCMIDWHILFDYDPNMHTEESVAFFDKMSAALADYDNIIYEICNEPSMYCDWNELISFATGEKQSDVVSWEAIKKYANQVIPAIRKNDPDAIVVCGTPTWSQRVDEAADSPLEYDNIMYALHFYASTHTQDLRDKITYALNKGIAIYVTEFGICDASGNGAIIPECTDAWMSYVKENKLSFNLWNLSNKNESSSVISYTCDKTTGWSYDELSESGKFFVDYVK